MLGQAEKDYDNFVFNFPSQEVGSISLFFIKNSPDSTMRTQAGFAYLYDFVIRDIIVNGEYKDFSAVYVSNPIVLSSSDNSKNIIDSIMLDAEMQNLTGNSIDFYIAKNVPLATSVNDFNWIPISPSSMKNASYSSVVSFNATNLNYKTIVASNSDSNSSEFLKKYSENFNTNIPGYENKQIYQVAKLDSNVDYREPIILEGFGKIKWYRTSYTPGRSSELRSWMNELIPKGSTGGVILSEQNYKNSSVFWTAPGINERRKRIDNF
jgi:hypothetical protein